MIRLKARRIAKGYFKGRIGKEKGKRPRLEYFPQIIKDNFRRLFL